MAEQKSVYPLVDQKIKIKGENMISVAIVEDERESAELLRGYLEQAGKELGEHFTADLFADGMDFISDYRGKYDLVLMDIEMPHLNGIAAAKKLRKLDERVTILFVTNMAQYAIKGYEVDALDFLIKPVTYYNFVAKLQKAVKQIGTRAHKRIFLLSEGEVRCVPVQDIRYVEVREHFLTYHLRGEDIVVRGQMDKAEAELAGYHFYRCYKCYLVNLDYVTSIGQNTVRVGNDVINVSRTCKKDFMQTLADYWGSAL